MYYIDYWQESVELAERKRPGSPWVCLALDPSLSDTMILWPFVQVGKVAYMCTSALKYSSTVFFLDSQAEWPPPPHKNNDLYHSRAFWHFEIGVCCHPENYPEDLYSCSITPSSYNTSTWDQYEQPKWFKHLLLSRTGMARAFRAVCVRAHGHMEDMLAFCWWEVLMSRLASWAHSWWDEMTLT